MPHTVARIWHREQSELVVILGLAVAGLGGIATTYASSTRQGLALLIAPVVVVALVAFMRKPSLGLWVLAGLAPLNVPFYLGDVTTGTTEALLVITAPALFLAWASSHSSVPWIMKVGSVLLTIGATIAWSVNMNGLSTWGLIRWMLVLNLILGGTTIIRSTISARNTYNLQLIFVFSSALVALLGIAQRLGIYAIIGPPYKPPSIDSTFGYYSNYTAFLALGFILSIFCLLFAPGGYIQKFLVFIASLLILSELASGLSRGAILCAAVGLALIALCTVKTPSRLVLMILAGGCGYYFVLFSVPGEVLRDFSYRFATHQGGDDFRESLQKAGTALLKDNPLGLGFGGFEAALEQNSTLVRAILPHPHRLWTAVGMEVGWLGLLGVGILTLFAVILGIRNLILMNPRLVPGGGFAICLAATLVQGDVDYFFLESANFVAAALLLVGALSPTLMSRQDPCEAELAKTETGSACQMRLERSIL